MTRIEQIDADYQLFNTDVFGMVVGENPFYLRAVLLCRRLPFFTH